MDAKIMNLVETVLIPASKRFRMVEELNPMRKKGRKLIAFTDELKVGYGKANSEIMFVFIDCDKSSEIRLTIEKRFLTIKEDINTEKCPEKRVALEEELVKIINLRHDLDNPKFVDFARPCLIKYINEHDNLEYIKTDNDVILISKEAV